MKRLALLILGSGVTFAAQEFEVVSVKPAVPGGPTQFQPCAGGRFVVRGTPLLWAVKWGYDLADYQVRDGWPSWLNAFGTYDIEAKAALPATEDQCRMMVQSLFEERFKLRVHRETREASAYVLMVAKNAPKLSSSGGVRINRVVKQNQWETAAPAGWDMPRLANYLAGVSAVGRAVVDRSGLKGTYGFTLDYAAREGDDLPSVFTALQEQLGLKLEATKAPVEMFVIDHVEKPSGN
jgi:uncharacterized protein (TIGR03435 family)